MVDYAEQPTVKPEVLLLEQLLEEIAAGALRVPDFQRAFVWLPEQMLNLYDSIERGYPIGSILVWETPSPLRSLDGIAGIDIPRTPGDRPIGYLLDGHQRLSTLFGSLARRPAPPGPDWTERKWWIYRALGGTADTGGAFQHWTGDGTPPATYLPLQAVLRTTDFLAFAKRLTREVDDPAECDALIDEAEALTQRIRSYKIAVIRLSGGDLSHAVEAFSRLNSAGQQITPDQMVSALTYRPNDSASLTSKITDIQQRTSEGGFGDIPRDTIFRTILAVAGEDTQEAQWGRLAERVREGLDEAVHGAEDALHRTVRFLRYEAGVPLAVLVPHPAQIMLLAYFHHMVPEPSGTQVRSLVRWFWATSWSGALGNASGARMGRFLEQMRDFATGGAAPSTDGYTAQPFPVWFDTDNSRVRAFILWELREFAQRLDTEGKPIDTIDELARKEFAAYRTVVPAAYPWRDSPANRLLLPTRAGVSVVDALLNLAPEHVDAVLSSHGIPREAVIHLRPDSPDEADDDSVDDDAPIDNAAEIDETASRVDREVLFIRARRAELIRRERVFMADMGVASAPTGWDGDDGSA